MRAPRGPFAVVCGLGLIGAAAPGLELRGEAQIVERGSGVTVERVDEALVPHGAQLDARDGDLVLDNGRMLAVVGASSAPGRVADHGAILDLTGPAFSDDALGSIRTGLVVDGQPTPVTTERVEAVRGKGGVPILRIVARTDTGMDLTTEIRSQAKSPYIELTTRVQNRGAGLVSVQVADAVEWPGAPTFVPGFGDVEQSGQKTVEWFGRGGPLAYGFVFPDGPESVDFHANQSETDQTAFGPVMHLSPRATALHRRVLVVSHHGISDVARLAAELAHRPIAIISGVLSPAPAWAELSAVAADGTVAMKASAREDGHFEMAVPPGRYRVQLESPGGWDEAFVDAKVGPAPAMASLVVPQAERLDFRVADVSGRGIPARIVVTGIEGTPDPRFGSLPRVSASGNEIHTVTGEGQVDIPPGRYRVLVSRGIEWSIVEKTIDVRPEQGVALRVELIHELPTPGWISADLHLHAKPSGDSALSLEDRVASLVSAGVEFAVATDHNHVTDYGPTIEDQYAHPYVTATSGVEVTTKTWGHFNAYPLPKGSEPPPWAGVDPAQIFDAVHRLSADAVIQVNHPWRAGYGYFHRAVLDERTGSVWRKGFSFDFDLIEVVNGYELADPGAFDRNLSRYFRLLNIGRRYTAVGSSDSHKLTNEWAGYPRTYVRVPDDRPEVASAQEIARSLKAGHTVVSLGPFVDAHVGQVGPGDTVSTTPGVVPLEISVRAALWVSVSRVDVVVNGEVTDSLDVTRRGQRTGLAWSQTVDVPATNDCWISVVVRGDRPLDEVLPGLHVLPFAFTNPIFVDVGAPAR